jgi:hypothetical protein
MRRAVAAAARQAAADLAVVEWADQVLAEWEAHLSSPTAKDRWVPARWETCLNRDKEVRLRTIPRARVCS